MKHASKVLLVAVQILFASPIFADAVSDGSARGNIMNDVAIQTLRTSSDRKELLKAAATLANSSGSEDHRVLIHTLEDAAFLAKLNSPEEYAGMRKRLRVRRILDVLAENPAPVSEGTLVALTRSRTFLAEVARVELLIQATAAIRPVPPDLEAFWDRYSQAEMETTTVVISALFINATDTAMTLFERKMKDPTQDEEEKTLWLRYEVLPNRNQPVVVSACARLLQSNLADTLKMELIDVLFDYKPAVWYTPAVNYNAPPIDTYSPRTCSELHELGEYALKNMALSEDRKAAIHAMLEKLGVDTSG